MRTILMQRVTRLIAAGAMIGALAGCERRGDETGRNVDAADTIVTTRQRQDTTIITRDTQVEIDTIRREGETRPTGRDTARRLGGTMADTASSDTMRR
jgi:hypothetical protein